MLTKIEHVKVGQCIRSGEICMVEDHPSRSKFLIRYWNWSTVESDGWKNPYGDDGIWIEYGISIHVYDNRESIPESFGFTTAQAAEAFQIFVSDGNAPFGTGSVHPMAHE